jgi:hypothetical protein
VHSIFLPQSSYTLRDSFGQSLFTVHIRSLWCLGTKPIRSVCTRTFFSQLPILFLLILNYKCMQMKMGYISYTFAVFECYFLNFLFLIVSLRFFLWAFLCIVLFVFFFLFGILFLYSYFIYSIIRHEFLVASLYFFGDFIEFLFLRFSFVHFIFWSWFYCCFRSFVISLISFLPISLCHFCYFIL